MERIMMQGTEVTLEGRFLPGTEGWGAVITHPHPLFGGSMDNNVVWAATRAFQARQWATLCFNFRGVGRSRGAYGGGEAEVEDVATALEFLKSRTPGPYYLVGYSFGAWVAARALLQGLEVYGAILIAPPIDFMDLAFLPKVPQVHLIVAGDRDDFCALRHLKPMLAKSLAPPELAMVAGADHFFWGQEDQLFQILRDQPLPGVAQ